ncbi:MAG TPA: NIPSNAP family protein [Blastococcus sp.]|jgi:hypothetical protein|nr:NIPSNAP family protein [Blastococcus sp.]
MLGVVELRQYTLHPGQRETLIRLFEREFIEPQEAAGIRVLGQFRDLDDPDRFVWMRGFPDLRVRPAALGEFYGGPVWARHRDAANATMVDSDDVLLLRPVPGGPAFRASDGVPPGSAAAIIVTVHPLREPPSAAGLERFADAGAGAIALLQTEPAPNNFPALPVREDEHVLVRVDRGRAVAWDVGALAAGRPQVLRLEPTDRSFLR